MPAFNAMGDHKKYEDQIQYLLIKVTELQCRIEVRLCKSEVVLEKDENRKLHDHGM